MAALKRKPKQGSPRSAEVLQSILVGVALQAVRRGRHELARAEFISAAKIARQIADEVDAESEGKGR